MCLNVSQERQSSPAYNHFTSGPSLLFHPQQSPGVGLGLGGLGGYGNANGAGVTQQPFYGADKQAVYEGMQEAAAAAGVEQYGFSHPSMGYQQFGDYGMQVSCGLTRRMEPGWLTLCVGTDAVVRRLQPTADVLRPAATSRGPGRLLLIIW